MTDETISKIKIVLERMNLMQVAVVGSKLVTIESQLATARYQNQGLKALLNRIEGKHEEATKQLASERRVSNIHDNSFECLFSLIHL
jgi:hypothetical protein